MNLYPYLVLFLQQTVPALSGRVWRAGTLYSNTMPAVVVQEIDDAPMHTHEGEAGYRTEFQISVYHDSLAGLDTLVPLVEAAMRQFRFGNGVARRVQRTERGFDRNSKLYSVYLDYELVRSA